MAAQTQAGAVRAADAATPEQAAELLRTRRTINRFRQEPPPREAVLRALDLARWAPNHHLTEPWHFYLIGEETRRGIIDLNTEMLTATKGAEAAEGKRRNWEAKPGWLAVSCDHSSDELQAWEDYAACACAIHNIALSLWSEGIGMKWSTGPVIRDARFYDLLWIDPDIEMVIALIWYGYPDESPVTHRESLECSLVELP
ncbi:nitroreductase family protein [Arhodomonas aquaeolei]|uniref:nitroreductase family protein n=1 Tax=Arhodomonas aquaeolei TaxID=2369 RepID=UPI00036B6DE8|nr:nitroreductase [Arhodomonas aquaeolei]